MNFSTMLLTAAALSCGVVNSIESLHDPIQYVDRSQSYFIGIKAHRYRMGTAVDAIKNPDEDMPQFSGDIEDCSSRMFSCRSIAYLKFVVPKTRVGPSTYDDGTRITIKQLANGGFHASAICPRVAPSGCASRTDGGGPVVTYQYEVSKSGVLTAIEIQHWNDQKIQVDHENLVLVSRLGLNLH